MIELPRSNNQFHRSPKYTWYHDNIRTHLSAHHALVVGKLKKKKKKKTTHIRISNSSTETHNSSLVDTIPNPPVGGNSLLADTCISAVRNYCICADSGACVPDSYNDGRSSSWVAQDRRRQCELHGCIPHAYSLREEVCRSSTKSMECSDSFAFSQTRKARAWLLMKGRTERKGRRNLLARSTRWDAG